MDINLLTYYNSESSLLSQIYSNCLLSHSLFYSYEGITLVSLICIHYFSKQMYTISIFSLTELDIESLDFYKTCAPHPHSPVKI